MLKLQSEGATLALQNRHDSRRQKFCCLAQEFASEIFEDFHEKFERSSWKVLNAARFSLISDRIFGVLTSDFVFQSPFRPGLKRLFPTHILFAVRAKLLHNTVYSAKTFALSGRNYLDR